MYTNYKSNRLMTRLVAAIVMPLLLLGTYAGGVAHAQSAGAATPEKAVTALVNPFADPAAGNNACNALTGRVDDCPVTEQLRTRLQHPIVNVETGNLVSRSQNPPSNLTVSLVDIIGDTARVNTHWEYGSSQAYNIEFIVKNVGGKWLVADTFCEGNPHTSIFRTPTGPCSAESAAAAEAAATPGMPNTGAADDRYAMPLALGLLVIAAGFSIVFAAPGRRRVR